MVFHYVIADDEIIQTLCANRTKNTQLLYCKKQAIIKSNNNIMENISGKKTILFLSKTTLKLKIVDDNI